MQLKKPSHPTWGVPTAISCIAMLLKEPVVRSSFVQADGVKLLIPLISPASTQQSIQVSFVTFQIAGLINVFLPKYLSAADMSRPHVDLIKFVGRLNEHMIFTKAYLYASLGDYEHFV